MGITCDSSGLIDLRTNLPLVSYKILKCSLLLGRDTTSGKLETGTITHNTGRETFIGSHFSVDFNVCGFIF
jgi:hypothetical protein